MNQDVNSERHSANMFLHVLVFLLSVFFGTCRSENVGRHQTTDPISDWLANLSTLEIVLLSFCLLLLVGVVSSYITCCITTCCFHPKAHPRSGTQRHPESVFSISNRIS